MSPANTLAFNPHEGWPDRGMHSKEVGPVLDEQIPMEENATGYDTLPGEPLERSRLSNSEPP